MCVCYELGVEDGDTDVYFMHKSQFMLSMSSVSDERNYLNVCQAT